LVNQHKTFGALIRAAQRLDTLLATLAIGGLDFSFFWYMVFTV